MVGLTNGGRTDRAHLLKATRRLGRTVRTEAKLFLARPTRRRPWTVPCALFLSVFFVGTFLTWLLWPGEWRFKDGGIERESGHFTHNARILPLGRQQAWDRAKLDPCSWLYFEVNAGDGRYTRGFFTNGNGFLEEYLRAAQASMRGFCAVVFEADPQMTAPLAAVRSEKGPKAKRFDVFPGMVVGAVNSTEEVILRENTQASSGGKNGVVDAQEAQLVRSVPFLSTIRSLTRPWTESGYDVGDKMSIATGNRQNGSVIVRVNAVSLREIYWYMQMLDSPEPGHEGIMCQRVDHLILNMQPMKFDATRNYLVDRRVIRDAQQTFGNPTDGKYDYNHGLQGVTQWAAEIKSRRDCRTTVTVFNGDGKREYPSIIDERSVFFSVLAGQPTFDERIGAQTNSWMKGVPKDRVAIYTNVRRSAEELEAAAGRDVVVTKPHKPELEQQLHMMQSWSHLVRVRETWDKYMRKDPSIEWLMLVDDDTFVFPGGLREYLSSFDSRVLGWGGSGEQARIDNGDAAVFANWLRDLNTKHGGKHCYLPGEDIPEKYQGRRITYAKSKVMNGRKVAHVVSHMCSDAFCKKGCPAVPQGATIFVSRALVEKLRPHIEKCEELTSTLCKNCGSQRLYMCINKYIHSARTYMTRGVCRATWRLEHRNQWPFAVTYHGFQKYKHLSLSTHDIGGDMAQLWSLGKRVEEEYKIGKRISLLIPMQNIADLIGCHGQATYKDGKCITEEGITLDGAHDGGPAEKIDHPGQRASDRKGSA